jgi:hypothetical protein
MIGGLLVARAQPLALWCLLDERRLQDQDIAPHYFCLAYSSNPSLVQFSKVPEKQFLLVRIVLTAALFLLHQEQRKMTQSKRAGYYSERLHRK